MVFLEDDDPLFRKDDSTIVDALALAAAVRNGGKENGQHVMASEPILGPYIQHEVLKIVGRLALANAPPCVCRGVASDIYKLIDVAGNAMREGYRGLLHGLLPSAETAEEAGPPPGHENGEHDEHAG